MLRIIIPESEKWDEKNNEFIYTKRQALNLEHSLVSVSKWESKWGIPFLTKKEKTSEQIIDYVRCMTTTQCVDPEVYYNLTNDNIRKIKEYIDAPMTATWFGNEKKGGSSSRVITSELIYYWMITLGIPFECQKWHLNRLISLIRVCNEENSPKKKMSRKALMDRNRALNAARRKRLNSKG